MQSTTTLHASCVAMDGKGVLITGPSGSGKSSLALQLMAFGAQLVADDRVALARRGDVVIASAPDQLPQAIEARFVGLLAATPASQAQIACAIDMAQAESQRLPDPRSLTVLGTDIPLYRRVDSLHFAPAILQLLRAGRAHL